MKQLDGPTTIGTHRKVSTKLSDYETWNEQCISSLLKIESLRSYPKL